MLSSASIVMAGDLAEQPGIAARIELVKQRAMQCLVDRPAISSANADDPNEQSSSFTKIDSPDKALADVAAQKPDPMIDASRLLNAQSPMPAAISLLRWRSTFIENNPPPAAYWQLQIQSLIDSGQIGWASQLLRDPATRLPSATAAAKLQLEIAEWNYAHGNIEATKQALNELKGKVPSDVQPLWQNLQSQISLRDGQYADAFAILSVGKHNDPAQPVFWSGDTLYPYMRYNLGVALINLGRIDEGRAVLDRIGRMPAKTSEMRALRDKANLTLGWQLLKQKQGETALSALGRIPLDGPFSNRALLGSGWAKLIGAGQTQTLKLSEFERDRVTQLPSNVVASLTRNGLIDCEDANRYYGYAMQPCVGSRLNRTKLPLTKEALLKRALVPWVELSERSPYDQAVQESWVAIPYALQQLGANEQAADYYDLAIKRLETLRQTYDAAITAADAGLLLPPPNLGDDAAIALPDARFDHAHTDTLALLFEAVPENIWSTDLKDERDLKWLAQQLSVPNSLSDASTDQSDLSQSNAQCGLPLTTELISVANELHSILEKRAATELRAQDAKLVQYLLSAREARAKSLEGLWSEQNVVSTKPEYQNGAVAGFFHSIKVLFSGDSESAQAVLPDETHSP